MKFDDVPKEFSWPDYVVFSSALLFSTGIGIFFMIKGRREKNATEAFLMGGRDMAIFPVAMSILASFTSAITILGVSKEVYANGTMYVLLGTSSLFYIPVTAHVFVPIFHRLNITSAYEYLERRFSRPVRQVASLIFILQIVMYMAVVLYAPALALNQVSGLSVWISIFVVGAVCTFYTAIGGMKAVIWSDTFQMIVVYAGMIAVIAEGSRQLGGLGVVWEIAKNGSRVQFDNFSLDPFERHTFFTIFFGGFIMSLTVYGSNQAMIQRYLTIKKLRDAQKSLYIMLPANLLVLSLVCLCGLVAYARYHDCDPLQAGSIQKYDQVLPFLVMDVLGHLQGLPGLFVACIFSASLSTVSGGVNALAAVCLRDFVQPIYKGITKKDMTDRQSILTSKSLALIFGMITIAMAFLADVLGSTVLQVTLSIFGMVGGPLLGLFVLGMFFPWANDKGALVGSVSALCVTMWIGIGAVLYPNVEILPMGSSGCGWNDTTTTTTMSTLIPTLGLPTEGTASSGVLYLYQLSYLWYAGLAVGITLLLGLTVSFLTGATDPSQVDPKLLFPLADYLCCCLPQWLRAKLRCGVRFKKEDSVPSSTALKASNPTLQMSESGICLISYHKY